MSSFHDRQYINVPPRNASRTDSTIERLAAAVRPPRIEAQQPPRSYILDSATGHDDPWNAFLQHLSPSHNDLSCYISNRTTPSMKVDQLLQQNALSMARAHHEATLRELIDTQYRNPPIWNTMHTLDRMHQQEDQAALLHRYLLHGSSFPGSDNPFALGSNLLSSYDTAAPLRLSSEVAYMQQQRLQQQQQMDACDRINITSMVQHHSLLNASVRNDSTARDSFIFSTVPQINDPLWNNISLPTTMRGSERAVAQHSHQRNTPSSSTQLSLPVCIARPSDAHKLNEYQCLLRQQIEAFSATQEDVETHRRGRNKPVTSGQVGIRCRHCAAMPLPHRKKGAVYFPSTKYRIYQAAQNMATAHMPVCLSVPAEIKEALLHLKATSSAGAGRQYWSHQATAIGLVDDDRGIRFVRDLPPE